ncbi:hypothetical protein Pint_19715 [Pistacia integerrima]|uniref:Uncharacterized protein n=1 Tax=Pistacia integerrima TaxID=434235 RepID=A0ACC0XAJ4_9ROSI|nr:hypothetical protein Pint_19715 [Pistacia integerrima]
MPMKISSKVLSNTDIHNRLSMETRSLQHLPRFPVGQNCQILYLEDEEGETWTFHLIIRKGTYQKPVLSAGWKKFVKKKNLQKGFKVEFFKERDEVTGQLKYKIKLKKPVFVFNKVLDYVPFRFSQS